MTSYASLTSGMARHLSNDVHGWDTPKHTQSPTAMLGFLDLDDRVLVVQGLHLRLTGLEDLGGRAATPQEETHREVDVIRDIAFPDTDDGSRRVGAAR